MSLSSLEEETKKRANLPAAIRLSTITTRSGRNFLQVFNLNFNDYFFGYDNLTT